MSTKLYTYPTSDEDLQQLRQFCEALQLPPPVPWHHTQLGRRLRELVSDPPTTETDWLGNARAAEIGVPVILFVAPEQPVLHEMIRRYKAIGQWPIMAVLTKPAQALTLAELIGHFRQDRGAEDGLRDGNGEDGEGCSDG